MGDLSPSPARWCISEGSDCVLFLLVASLQDPGPDSRKYPASQLNELMNGNHRRSGSQALTFLPIMPRGKPRSAGPEHDPSSPSCSLLRPGTAPGLAYPPLFPLPVQFLSTPEARAGSAAVCVSFSPTCHVSASPDLLRAAEGRDRLFRLCSLTPSLVPGTWGLFHERSMSI